MDLKNIKGDKDEPNKLEFSLIPGSNATDSESKHDDTNETVISNDIDFNNNDCGETGLNTNEHDLWRALWQKLNYNLSMSLYKVGMNQWQSTHTLYFEMQSDNEKKENENNNDKNRLLVKSLNDLIFIAKSKIDNNGKQVENIKGRIVLKLKVKLATL